MAHLPLDGTWRYDAAHKVLTHNGAVVNFSYYSPRPSGIHRAVDLTPLPSGSTVRAVYGGIVSRIGYDASGWGRYLRVKDSAGHEQLYAHLESIPVKLGQRVAEGQYIAKSDNTGNSTGPHLHLEFWWVAGQRSTSIESRQLLVRIVAPPVTAPFDTPAWAKNFRQGNTGANVMFIQYALADWRIDGIFDSALTTKVKAFQKAHHIPQSGVVGTRTGPLLAKLTH